jgi:hypothetical protein
MKLLEKICLLLLVFPALPGLAESGPKVLEALESPVEFTGKNNVVLPNGQSILSGVSAATLMVWEKTGTPTTKAQHLVSESIGGGHSGWASRASFGIQPNGSINAWARSEDNHKPPQEVRTNASTIRPGRWQHIAVTVNYAENSILVFVDGERVLTNRRKSSFAKPTTPNTPSDRITLGSEDDGSDFFFHGSLVQMKIWPRALSAEEIRKYASQRPKD